jgi:hypothetical protein
VNTPVDTLVTFLSNPIVDLVIGFILGIVGAFLFWWSMAHIVPKVEFHNHISKTSTTETASSMKYRIKFWNAGRRNIIDVEISARLKVRGLSQKPHGNLSIYSVPLGYDRLPTMWAASSAKAKADGDAPTHITRLDVHKIAELKEASYAEFLNKKLRENERIRTELDNSGTRNTSDFDRDPQLLEHLLSLGKEASLEIAIFAYDEYSGTRKVFTKKYGLKDIKMGTFST